MSGPRPNRRLAVAVIALALTLATASVYAPVGDFGFVSYDDPEYVADHPIVRAGLTGAGLKAAFGEPHHGNWHPLTTLSNQLDVELFGVDPGAMHRVNAGLHAVSALLLFALLLRTTGAVWRSGAVAALFALHPLHVESVAWISERKDVLSGLLALLTTHAYVSYVGSPGVARYLLVVLCFAAGLLAKPMLVTWPFALLLLDVWPLRRFERAPPRPGRVPPVRARLRRAVLEKLPLLVLSGASSAITLRVQQAAGALQPVERHPLAERLGNALGSYVVYLRKLVWPADLAVLYPYPESLPGWQLLGCGALLACISAGCLRLWRRHPEALIGWLFYLGTLVPVIGLVQVGAQPYADRYSYLPLIGIFVAVVWLAGGALEGRKRLWPAAGVIACSALAALGWLASRQVGVWRDSISLYQHALRVTQGTPILYNNLGIALVDAGRLEEALEVYRDGLASPAHFAQVLHYNAGIAYGRLGRHGEALANFDAALRADPDHEEALFHKGRALAALGRLEEAKRALQRVVALAPGVVEPQLELGLVLGKLGDLAGARHQFLRALELQPGHLDARINLAVAQLKSGDATAAIRELEQVLRLSPGHSAATRYLEAAGRQRALESPETAAEGPNPRR